MYNIKIESYFSSAHFLRGYRGKCEELHGHNWKIEVTVEAEKLDKIGMVLDFKVLKMKLNKVLERLDHKCLNNIPYFSATGSARGGFASGEGSASGGKKVNPTSENIARYVYDNLKQEIQRLKSVTVWENDTSSATYKE